MRGFELWNQDWFSRNWVTIEDLQAIKALGLDSIVVKFWFSRVLTQAGTYDPLAVAKVDNIVNLCGQAGLNAILSIRICRGIDDGSSWAGWLKHWFYAQNGIADVYNQSGAVFKSLQKFFKAMISRYDHNAHVRGYCLGNFIYHRVRPQEITDIAIQQYSDAIDPIIQNARLVTNKLLQISPIHKGGLPYIDRPEWRNWFEFMPVIRDHNVQVIIDGYSPRHPYGVSRCTANYNGDKDGLRELFRPAIDYKKERKVNLCVDEFSVYQECTDTENKLLFLRHLLELFKEFSPSWFHHFGYSTESLNGFVSADHEIIRPKTVELLKQFAGNGRGDTRRLIPLLILMFRDKGKGGI